MIWVSSLIFCLIAYSKALWVENAKSNNIIKDRQLILDLHNWYRAQVSRGDVYQQSEAADMIVMEWDDRLEEMAQSLAQNCRSDVDLDEEQQKLQRSVLSSGEFGELAMNEFLTNRTANYFQMAISSWFNNHLNYSFDSGTCSGSNCNQYKNMIYSNAFIVGCDSSQCLNGRYVVCVYANSKKNSLENRLYKAGLSCTSCPQHFSHCMDGSLCASKNHCSNSKISKTCRCLVIRDLCFKHGDFDSNRCRCRCQPGWTGLNCEKRCEDVSPNCSERQLACTDVKRKQLMYETCQATCKWCQNNPIAIPIFNEHKVTINTIYDLNYFELGVQHDMTCQDMKQECAAWASQGHCDKESVSRVCKQTCNTCGEISKPTSQINGCSDHPTCVPDFAPYCNIMMQIFVKCPKLCGRCMETTMEFIIQSTTSFQRPPSFIGRSNRKNVCLETPDRKETCNSILLSNLCSKDDMSELCPITCKNPSCKILSTSSSLKSSTTNPTTYSIISDSEVCRFLPCDSSGVRSFCRNKCAGYTFTTNRFSEYDDPSYCNIYPCSIPFVDEVCKKCADPEICISLDCNYNGVPKMCKKKCNSKIQATTPKISTSSIRVSSTTAEPSISSKFSTIQISDSTVCFWLPCASANIVKICPQKCGTTLPSSSSSTTTFKSTSQSPSVSSKLDPPVCAQLPCRIPQVKLVCPNKCYSITSKSRAKLTSSTIATKFDTTTSGQPTDPGYCAFIPCSTPGLGVTCPIKCASTIALRSTPTSSTISTSTAANSVSSMSTESSDPSFCLYVQCSGEESEAVCPVKCAATKIQSTPTTVSQSTDHPLCVMWPCTLSVIGSLCPNKCFSTTAISTRISSTTKHGDPSFCNDFPCIYPQVKSACPLKCGISTSGSPSVTSSTEMTTPEISTASIGTDFPLCIFVFCDSIDSLMACPVKCGQTRFKSSISFKSRYSSTTPITETDSPMCLYVICDSVDARMACPVKCASTTSGILGVTTVQPIDSSFCTDLPCDYPQVKNLCPLKCGISTSQISTASSTMTTSSSSSKRLSIVETDNPICAQLPCSNAGVRSLCKTKCGRSSIVDLPICESLPCSNLGVRQLCLLKCADYPTSKSSSIEITSEPSSTAASSTSSMAVSTDDTFCLLFPCSIEGMSYACPRKCGLIDISTSL